MSDAPLRILHIMPQIGIGGAELQLHALIAHSDPGMMRHHVLHYDDGKDDEGLRMYGEAGISLQRVYRNRRRPIRFIRDLSRAIRSWRPDVVQCWLWSGSMYGRVAAKWAGSRCIVNCYRSAFMPYGGISWLFERIAARGIIYMANSHACARGVAETIGVDPNRFHVVYNGLDVSRSQVEPDPRGLREELGIASDMRIVLKVGRLTHAKNYPMLLRIARRSRGRLPVHFLIAGHGELEGELRSMAKSLVVDDIVHFLGLRSDVPRLMRSSDIFCYTSWYEGFPNAPLEAMVAGLPIVIAGFPGADELITDGQNGRVVPIDDDEAAFERLYEYIKNPEAAATFGRCAQQRAIEVFSMEQLVRNSLAFYQRISEDPAATPVWVQSST